MDLSASVVNVGVFNAAAAFAQTSRKFPFLSEKSLNFPTPVPMLIKGLMFLVKPP